MRYLPGTNPRRPPDEKGFGLLRTPRIHIGICESRTMIQGYYQATFLVWSPPWHNRGLVIILHPGVELRANPKSIFLKCHLFEVALYVS